MPDALIEVNSKEIIDLLHAKERATADAMKGEAERVKREMLTDFRITTASWAHQVDFQGLVDSYADGSFTVLVGTDDPIYGYVNSGTRPHTIVPVRAKALRFQWGGKGSYMAKTTPGVIGAHSGGSSGPIVYRQGVHHPGTKARGFVNLIRNKAWSAAIQRITRKLIDAWGK